MTLQSRSRNTLSLLALGTLLLHLPARAQERGEGAERERERVERIAFEGAEALDERLLRGAIMTRETRCRGFLLQPFCWLLDWHVLVERQYLDRAELPRDELRLRVIYFRRGFREAAVASRVRPHGAGVEVVFEIDEGPPTMLVALEVEQSDQVLSGRDIRRAGLPRVDEPLNLLALDTAIARLSQRLGARGFLDAVVRDTVIFSGDERASVVAVSIQPGSRSTLEGLDIRGNESVDDPTIADALLLRRGRVLRNRDLVAGQRSLYESNLFHEAQVVLPEQPDSAKRLVITVREAPPRSARVGGGFSTLEFGQAEARYTHYNWLGRGRRLDLHTAVGNLLASRLTGWGPLHDALPADAPAQGSPFLKPTWLASAELMQPSFRAAPNRLGIGLFAHRRVVPGIAVDEGFGGNVSLTRQFDHRAPASLSYRFERAAVEAGDLYFCVHYVICEIPTIEAVRGPHNLSPLAVGFFTDRADDPLSPTEGYRTRIEIEHASGITLSDFHYHRISGEATYYHPLGIPARRVITGRARGGWVLPLERNGDPLGLEGIGRGEAEGDALLHPRKRFYAGGARSVRGYWENQLGPRILTADPEALIGENGACAPEEVVAGTCDPAGAPADAFWPRPVGGTTVLEGSVELRFPLWREIRGAVFVDGAVVGERIGALFAEGTGAVTPGFGARLRTPLGPLRIDIGIRPSLSETLPVVTEHVDEHGVRHLVHLQTPRRWSPADADAGPARRLLAHLRLHLSIGEAY
jgi:outer membrane protein assembly factor BamA